MPGVIRAECPKCTVKKKSESLDAAVFYDARVHTKEATSGGSRRPILPIEIHGMQGTAVADTGASRCIAGKNLYNLLKCQCKFEPEQVQLTLADGSTSCQEVLTTSLEVTLKGKRINTKFLVLPGENDNSTLLGCDFLSQARVVINPAEGVWYFQENPTQPYPYADQADSPTVAISHVSAADVQLRSNEGAQLDAESKLRLNELLVANEEVFRPGGGPTPYAEHCINIAEGQSPISMPPYKMAKPKKEILKKELERMLREGVIEECESPWAAPVVMVPKKDGTMRVCIDYRRLNEVTVADKYPMPQMDELLHAAKRTPFMSTLDLRTGYHQVSVRNEDRDKTAFITPLGTYRYCRMPFGLKNAPSTFQRLIDRFRAGVDANLLAYLDDLIVLSETFEGHLKDLQLVFDRLQKFNLRANRAKCYFACNEVKYLGHVLTSEGIQVDPTKVSAITDMPSPNNVKHLKSFLQTCSWYRKFIKDFSEIARPLCELTRKNTPWKWEERQERSFEQLKVALTTAPVLIQADENLPFTIRTDASG